MVGKMLLDYIYIYMYIYMYYHVLPCITMYYHVLPCITMYYHIYIHMHGFYKIPIANSRSTEPRIVAPKLPKASSIP